MSKAAAKREDLRNKIIGLAEARIARDGLSSLRARELAAEAGCALGGLYNMFADMDALILEVNGRTLTRIAAAMESSAPSPKAQLKALARNYLTFARENPLLWRALFDHHLPDARDLPDWYAEKLNGLMGRIATPIARLQPKLDEAAIMLRTRTIFAAVHGVVSISLDNRFVGLAAADLEQELQRFVDLVLAGVEATSAAG